MIGTHDVSLVQRTRSTRVAYGAVYARFALPLREFASAVDQCCCSSKARARLPGSGPTPLFRCDSALRVVRRLCALPWMAAMISALSMPCRETRARGLTGADDDARRAL
jgi:hypothetical protein